MIRRLALGLVAALLALPTSAITYRSLAGSVITDLHGAALASGTVTFQLLGNPPASAALGLTSSLSATCTVTTGVLGTCLLPSPAQYRVTIAPSTGGGWTLPRIVSLAESSAATTLDALYLAAVSPPTITPTCVTEGANANTLASGSAVSGQVLTADGAGAAAWVSPGRFLTGTRPACDAAHRGTVWYVAGGAGVADTFAVCLKLADDSYQWTSLF